MLRIVSIFLTAIAIVVPLPAQHAPIGASNELLMLNGRLKDGITEVRLRLQWLSASQFLDPGPSVEGFSQIASGNLLLGSFESRELGMRIISDLRREEWIRSPKEGYPRWCLQFVQPWDTAVFSVLVDTDNQLIWYENNWYKMSKETVNGCSRGILDSVISSIETKVRR